MTLVLGAVSCSALIKLRKHRNRGASSAHINPTSYIPPFVICVIPHIIPLKPYHITGFHPPPPTHTHLMTLKASLRQISTNDEQECVWLPRGDKHKRISISSQACLQTIYNIITACRLRRRPRWILTRPQVVFLNVVANVHMMNKTLEIYSLSSLQTCQNFSNPIQIPDTGAKLRPPRFRQSNKIKKK